MGHTPPLWGQTRRENSEPLETWGVTHFPGTYDEGFGGGHVGLASLTPVSNAELSTWDSMPITRGRSRLPHSEAFFRTFPLRPVPRSFHINS